MGDDGDNSGIFKIGIGILVVVFLVATSFFIWSPSGSVEEVALEESGSEEVVNDSSNSSVEIVEVDDNSSVNETPVSPVEDEPVVVTSTECGKNGGPCCGRTRINETLDVSVEEIYVEQFKQHIYCDEGYACHQIGSTEAICYEIGGFDCGDVGEECCRIAKSKKIYIDSDGNESEVFVDVAKECVINSSCGYDSSNGNYYCS